MTQTRYTMLWDAPPEGDVAGYRYHSEANAPHLWTGATAFAAGMHVAAASPAGFILEYSLGANPLLHDLVTEKFVAVDGMIEIPERPGLGITVDPAFVERYAVAE